MAATAPTGKLRKQWAAFDATWANLEPSNYVMMSPMRVLVTGGSGFIGSNLVRRLLDAGDEVVVLDDLSTGDEANLAGLDLDLIEASVLDRDAVDEATIGVESIVHLAALGSVPRSVASPIPTHEVNSTGTLVVLDAARRRGAHFVLASSSSVYGSSPSEKRSEAQPTLPMSPYAASKLAAESYCLAFAESYGLQAVAFRLFNVYGPRQSMGHAYAAVIPNFVSAALSDTALQVFGDGQQTRDFTFVDVVAEVLSTAVHRRITCQGPVNLAAEQGRSVLDVISELEAILDTSLTIDWREARVGEVRKSVADCSRLRALLGDLPSVTLREGLTQTVEWYRGQLADSALTAPVPASATIE